MPTTRAAPPASDERGGITRHAVSGVLWMAWGKGIFAVLQMAVLVVLARLLTPADFGVVSAAAVVTGFSAIFSDLGIGPALVQRPTLEPRHLQAGFVASVLFGLAIGGIIWLLAPAVALFFKIEGVTPILRAIACTFPIRGLGVAAESLMQRELRFRWLAGLEVVSYAVGYAPIGIVLAVLGYGPWALAWAIIGQSVLRTVVLLVARPPVLRAGSMSRTFGEFVYFGSGFTAARIANYVALQGDNLVVGRWLGPAALGLYGRAYQLMAVPAVHIGQALDSVLFPAMARVQDEPHRLAVAYRRGVALVALLMCPASAALIVLAPELIHVLFGPRWMAVVAPFRILTAGMLFRTSYRLSDALTRATGAVYRRAWRQVVYASLVLGGSWVGQHWGLAGVAYGVLVALGVNFLLMAHLSVDLAGMSWRAFAAAHVPALWLAVVSGAVAWAVAALLRHWATPPMLMLAVAGGAALATALVLARGAPRWFLGADGRWMLEIVWSLSPLRRRPIRSSDRAPVW